jgi:ABC-type transport system involved in multi-copper enzyme maturation permease subunit
MRWLLLKDLRILRRSPLLVGMLVVYPVAIALMIGFALSSPPGKPKVAFYTGVAPGKGKIHFGTQQLDVAKYAQQLFQSVQPIHASSPAQAVADVRAGRAEAALIVPRDIVAQIQGLLQTGNGNPTVQLILNSKNPLERQFAEQAVQMRVDQVQQAVSKQVLATVVDDLQVVLNGGKINFLGHDVQLLGLRNARAIVEGAIAALPRSSPLVPALHGVVAFADVAIAGLAFAGPALGQIGTPLTVQVSQLAGRTTPTAAYAVAIAAVVSLMFVALLLGAGMLALERSEHTYLRLVRGPVGEWTLLCEKGILAAACAVAVALLMSALVSSFVSIEWSRFELWVLALAGAGIAFGALGVTIGAVAREVSAASLMAFLFSLPIAFLALIPATAVSGALARALDAISFVFPFRAALEAVASAFSDASPGIGLPLLHLVVLGAVYAVLSRLALVRFAR